MDEAMTVEQMRECRSLIDRAISAKTSGKDRDAEGFVRVLSETLVTWLKEEPAPDKKK